MSKKIIPVDVQPSFVNEPMIRPFGFKGGAMTEMWQTVLKIQTDSHYATGLGTQNVLWSDAAVFAAMPESDSNQIMYELSCFAAELVRNRAFSNPVDLLNDIFDEVYQYGIRLSGRANLRKTFALNSLVPLDNALWVLYMRENGLTSFDQLIPEQCRPALSSKNAHVAAIPLISYHVPTEEIRKIVEEGYFFMKIKIGQPGSQEEMLERDKARLSAIQNAIGSMETPNTANGKLPWYFDANGRYEKKETLARLLDHAEKIGMLDQIALVEEPFPEEANIDVFDLPVRLAADESAHTPDDVLERIQRGYKAIALKPAAKTLSVSMLMAQVAFEHDIPCFCADLTVNPILVDWNKNVAARLTPFPGLGTGLLESNGAQNYRNWQQMCDMLPFPNADWVRPQNGLFVTNQNFFDHSGGIFDDPRL